MLTEGGWCVPSKRTTNHPKCAHVLGEEEEEDNDGDDGAGAEVPRASPPRQHCLLGAWAPHTVQESDGSSRGLVPIPRLPHPATHLTLKTLGLMGTFKIFWSSPLSDG